MKVYHSDIELWKEVLSGDIHAYEYLYSSYVTRMFNYGMKISHENNLVKDAIQEVFINIIHKRERLSEVKNIKLYLFKALRLELWRQLKREQKIQDIEELDFSSEFSIEDQCIKDEIAMIRVNEITKALNNLPKRQKEAIFLKYYEGLSYQEISEIMQTEQSSAYKIVYKAIEALYQKLSLKSGKLFY